MKKWMVYRFIEHFDTEEEARNYIFSLQEDPDADWEELVMLEVETK